MSREVEPLQIARNIKLMLTANDDEVFHQAIELITTLAPQDQALAEALRVVFSPYLGEMCRLHSISHQSSMRRLFRDADDLEEEQLIHRKVSAGWALSYACGFWDEWAASRRFEISAHDYEAGQLSELGLLQLLRGRHVRILSPLSAELIRLIKELCEVEVASIKLDSLCDETLGALIALGESALSLLEAGAYHAERSYPVTCVARADEVYTRWVKRCLSRHKVNQELRARWAEVLLRGSLAKTLSIPKQDARFKLVYCPIDTWGCSDGLWVSRTLTTNIELDASSTIHLDEVEGVYSFEAYEVTDAIEIIDDLSRAKRLRVMYKNPDPIEFDPDLHGLRLPLIEEITEFGAAGQQTAYSGTDDLYDLMVEDRDYHYHEYTQQRCANAWGVYDVASLTPEMVWDDEVLNGLSYETLDDCVLTYGASSIGDPKKELNQRLKRRHGDLAFRVVLPHKRK